MTQTPSVVSATSTNRVHDVEKPVQTTTSARSLPTALSVSPALPISKNQSPARCVGKHLNVLPEWRVWGMIIAYVHAVRQQTTVPVLHVVDIVYWWWHPTGMRCAKPVMSKGKLPAHRVVIPCQRVEVMPVSPAIGREHAVNASPLAKPVSLPKR